MTRILIVEDDREGADAIRQYLEFRGFQADVVSSGEAAMEAVGRGGRYDVVITDLHLPGIQGDELAIRLGSGRGAGAQQRGRPKLIGLSGEHAATREPFDVRLPKPCRPKALVDAISGLLNADRS